MIVASVAVFVYQNSTTKLFGPTAAVYVATAVIMNLFLIYTITRAKSIVSRTFFAMANGLGIAFCLVSLFGVSPLTVKIGVGVEDDLRLGENVDTATERVYKFVEEKLIQKTREVEEELKRGK